MNLKKFKLIDSIHPANFRERKKIEKVKQKERKKELKDCICFHIPML